MTDTLSLDLFRGGLVTLIDEIFANADKQMMLDPGGSLFETLADVTAGEASIPVSDQSASIAGQVNHVTAFVTWLNDLTRTGNLVPLDWAATWRVTAVTDGEWKDLVARLHTAYDGLHAFASTNQHWDQSFVTGAFQIVGHCAYHLGEIRQGLGVIRTPRP